jgi:hypothetical protein
MTVSVPIIRVWSVSFNHQMCLIAWEGFVNLSYYENFRVYSKKREYLKDKMNELAANSKNNNITELYRGIN